MHVLAHVVRGAACVQRQILHEAFGFEGQRRASACPYPASVDCSHKAAPVLGTLPGCTAHLEVQPAGLVVLAAPQSPPRFVHSFRALFLHRPHFPSDALPAHSPLVVRSPSEHSQQLNRIKVMPAFILVNSTRLSHNPDPLRVHFPSQRMILRSHHRVMSEVTISQVNPIFLNPASV